jgi:hypothetical protein
VFELSIEGEDPTQNFRVVFKTKEEKDKYVVAENAVCQPHLAKYAAAWTKAERAKAKQALYIARMNFMKKYFSDSI